jgi:hypothetical protein
MGEKKTEIKGEKKEIMDNRITKRKCHYFVAGRGRLGIVITI